jgi:hypothetical protein
MAGDMALILITHDPRILTLTKTNCFYAKHCGTTAKEAPRVSVTGNRPNRFAGDSLPSLLRTIE